MKSLYRILGPVLAGLVAAAMALPLSEGSPIFVIVNGAVALILAFVFFNTETIFKGLTADGLFYVATGLFLA